MCNRYFHFIKYIKIIIFFFNFILSKGVFSTGKLNSIKQHANKQQLKQRESSTHSMPWQHII